MNFRVLPIVLALILCLVSFILTQDTPATDYTDVAYASDPRQVLDFWPAKSDQATPVLVFFHGGGFIRGDKNLQDLQKAAREVVEEFSAIVHASTDDAPVYLNYGSAPQKKLSPEDTDMKKTIHDAKFGILLKEKLDKMGVECTLPYPGQESQESELDFY